MFIKKLILIFILFVTCVSARENQKVTLYLDWLHQFQFAGYYIAKEKNYYNDFGLDVNIKEFNSDSLFLTVICKLLATSYSFSN